MTPLGVELQSFCSPPLHSNHYIRIHNINWPLLRLLNHTTYILPAKLTNQRSDFSIWCCFQLENAYMRHWWRLQLLQVPPLPGAVESGKTNRLDHNFSRGAKYETQHQRQLCGGEKCRLQGASISTPLLRSVLSSQLQSYGFLTPRG